MFLAIDQSTSATKAILLDAQLAVVGKATCAHRQHYPAAGLVQHDAEEIWQNTLAALQQLATEHSAEFQVVTRLSITNQRETFVVFDPATGRPLAPAVVWQCRSGDAVCEKLKKSGNAAEVRRRTGLPVDSYFSAPKFAQLLQDNSDLAEKLRAGEAVFGTIDTYLIHRLTGGAVFATDSTNASRTQLFDIHDRAFSPWLCETFGVPMTCLPEVKSSFATFGRTNLNGLLPGSVPIAGVMGDSQAALFAHRGVFPGQAKVTLGTGSSLLLNIGHAVSDPGEGGACTIAFTDATGHPTYCFEGMINYSAATIAWLKDQLGLLSSAAESETLAASLADNGGVYLVPAFGGLGAPHWSPNARAAIVGLTSASTRAHIARAGLEAIAFQIDDLLSMMRQQAGVTLTALHADGGPTANTWLMQFLSDVCNLPIVCANLPECSALGAVFAGMHGSGVSFEDLKDIPLSNRTYTPSMSESQRQALRTGWQQAVRKVLS